MHTAYFIVLLGNQSLQQRRGRDTMIRSMTGFGRGEAGDTSRRITIEMKSVNHRFLDLGIKLPRKLNPFEGDVRHYLKEQICRGKVDVFVTLEESADSTVTLQYNPSIAALYLQNLQEMSREFNLEYDIKTSHLSRFPDVFEVEEKPEDEGELLTLLMEALQKACSQFLDNRQDEGRRLAEDLQSKMDEMSSLVTALEQRSPAIVAEYRTRLREKVSDLLADGHIDESRLAAEIVLYSDKVCIDEEMVRLRSHVEETRNLLSEGTEVGRKLDFIAQEMNREANTILSKSTDVEIAGIGISLKTLIEKIREQIQNLE
jgi:uncharacterized protein (TIGR00255 family)